MQTAYDFMLGIPLYPWQSPRKEIFSETPVFGRNHQDAKIDYCPPVTVPKVGDQSLLLAFAVRAAIYISAYPVAGNRMTDTPCRC